MDSIRVPVASVAAFVAIAKLVEAHVSPWSETRAGDYFERGGVRFVYEPREAPPATPTPPTTVGELYVIGGKFYSLRGTRLVEVSIFEPAKINLDADSLKPGPFLRTIADGAADMLGAPRGAFGPKIGGVGVTPARAWAECRATKFPMSDGEQARLGDDLADLIYTVRADALREAAEALPSGSTNGRSLISALIDRAPAS